MKKFIMKADIEFSAENIEDAFEKLSNHFINLLEFGEFGESDLIEKGNIEIKLKDK